MRGRQPDFRALAAFDVAAIRAQFNRQRATVAAISLKIDQLRGMRAAELFADARVQIIEVSAIEILDHGGRQLGHIEEMTKDSLVNISAEHEQNQNRLYAAQ